MRKRVRRSYLQEAEMELSMTPMIDVVFQLLIYFLLTFSTADVLAHLDISHPAPAKSAPKVPTIGTMIRVKVLPKDFVVNQRRVSEGELRDLLQRLAAVSKKQAVMVVCDERSKQGQLIVVLDACAKSGLTQVSVMSAR